jgi:PAS domain-containing protein
MSDGPAILLADDEPDHRLLLASALLEAMPEARIFEAGQVAEAVEVISSEEFDAVLCEYRFGGSTALHLLRAIRERGLDAAFLLVTNHGSEEVARQAFVEGVADYVTKDEAIRNPAGLARRVRRAVEKHRLTEEHGRAEALLESFLENNPYTILIFDPRGHIVRWNRAPLVAGEAPDDLERLRTNYSPFEDSQLQEAGVLDCLAQAASGQWVEIPPFPWDPARAGLTGPSRIFRGVAFPIGIKGDDAPHLCTMIQDVTAEEVTRRERDEYGAILSSLLDASQAAILFVDLDLKVRFANRFVEEFFGIEPTAFVGRPRNDLAAELAGTTVDPEAFLQRREYLDQNPDVEADDLIEVVRPKPRYLRRHSGPVRGPGNGVLGRIEVYVDETETVERQHLLEEQNRELDVFASRLAHDLKTPLVSLRGFADLLERKQARQLDEQGRLYLDKVR